MEKNRITMRPMLVGLCGRSGSGKGYVSERFLSRGIPSVDTDAVYREMTAPTDVLSPCMKELVECFGDVIVNPDNSLDRGVMRSIVFGENRDGALRDLNRITHKHILRETLRISDELYEKGYDIVLIDAPLLFESGFDKYCSAVVAVTAPEETVIRRIMRRDGIDREAAALRLKTQKSVDYLVSRADYVIVNDGDDIRMDETIDRCTDELMKKARRISGEIGEKEIQNEK